MNIDGALYQVSALLLYSNGPVNNCGLSHQDLSNQFLFFQHIYFHIFISELFVFFSVASGAVDGKRQHATQYITASSCFIPWDPAFQRKE